MRLVLISPKSISHKVSDTTTVRNLQTIQTWLPQWSVPNNYKQVIIDMDAPQQEDPFKVYAAQFLREYRGVIGHTSSDDVMDEFTFTIRVLNVTLGKPFWSGDGHDKVCTVRQLADGLLK